MKMKREILATVVTGAALLLALLHAWAPSLGIDSTTVLLLAIAVLPWLGSIFKSVELPGGLKVEYQDLEKVRAEAAKADLLAPSSPKEEPTYLMVAPEDPNLALAGLRIEIERRLRLMAQKQGLEADRLSVGPLLRQLRHGRG